MKLGNCVLLVLSLLIGNGFAQPGGELRFCLRSEPKTFNPLLVEDNASEAVRYMTAGTLVRLNRSTQQLEAALATSWQVSLQGRRITFKLRDGLRFSDGTAFSADDVAYTMQQLMDPALHSPTGDAFRSAPGEVKTAVLSPTRIRITFPAPVASLERLFDQVGIMSAKSPRKEMAVLGPFYVADHKPGSYVLLKKNANYWKQDASGRRLPYLDSVRLEVQQNRDTEILRFVRGEIHIINSLDAEYFEKLSAQSPHGVRDAGVSLDTEQMWFNQVPNAPIPEYKKAWFRSTEFRRAISEAINREDLSRVVYGGHARPAAGPVSPGDKLWFNAKLKPHAFNPDSALARLRQDGFRLDNGVLRDRDGHAVEFAIVTNSGNKARERMAVMIQQDLKRIGVQVAVATLDFPSLIDRMTRSFNYEACLLGLTNVDLDPNGQMNVWLSSSENHQWNPGQKTPATGWEAEIDRLMRAQAASADFKTRKRAFDRVQEIAWQQEPFIYLVNKNALAAISPMVSNAYPVILNPQTFWNVDQMELAASVARNK